MMAGTSISNLNTANSRLLAAQNTLSVAWDTKSKTDIDIAVTKWASLVSQITRSQKEYAPALSTYAIALLLRWNHRHRQEDLDLAIRVLEQALAVPTPPPGRFESLVNLGAAFMDRWETFQRDPNDLLAAIKIWEQARSITSNEKDLFKTAAKYVLPHLADACDYAYSRNLVGRHVIVSSISHLRTAMQYADTTSQNSLQYRLGKSFFVLYLSRKTADDLQAARFHLQEAVAGNLPPNEMEDAILKLKDLYLEEYENTRSRPALEAAIYWAREVIEFDEGDMEALRSLASLLARFSRDFDHPSSLVEAIDCYDQVLGSISTADFEDLDAFYHNFGVVMVRQYLYTKKEDQRRSQYIQRALQLLRLAMEHCNEQNLDACKATLKIAESYYDQEKENPIRSRTPLGNVSQENQPPPFLAAPPQAVYGRSPHESTPTLEKSPGKEKEKSVTFHESNLEKPLPISLKSLNFEPRPTRRGTLPPSNQLHSSILPKVYQEVQVWSNHFIQQPTLHLSNQLNASFPQPKPQPKPQESPITVDPLTPRIVDAAMVDDIPNADDPIMPISEASIQPSNLTGRVIRTSDEAIAEGGFASIFIGTFEETKVAIKIIKPSYHQSSDRLQKKLHREMDVWWKLEHPNIVSLLGYADEFGPFPSMISPWHENGNAADYVQREGLGIEFRLNLLKEVSTGLRYLHSQTPAIVHGDLKPGNVLIDNSGIAKICDFGLSHLVASENGATNTTLGSNVGTVRYSAPELRCPEDEDESIEATTRSDIYSLACIGYEFLCQKVPFDGKNSIAAIIAAGYQHIPPAKKNPQDSSVLGPIAPHFWDLFDISWNEVPSKRPDIEQFCQQIDLAFEFYH